MIISMYFNSVITINSKNCNSSFQENFAEFAFAIESIERPLSQLKDLKGYLHYKKIASQNVSSEAQIKNFFISQKSYVSFSRY